MLSVIFRGCCAASKHCVHQTGRIYDKEENKQASPQQQNLLSPIEEVQTLPGCICLFMCGLWFAASLVSGLLKHKATRMCCMAAYTGDEWGRVLMTNTQGLNNYEKHSAQLPSISFISCKGTLPRVQFEIQVGSGKTLQKAPGGYVKHHFKVHLYACRGSYTQLWHCFLWSLVTGTLRKWHAELVWLCGTFEINRQHKLKREKKKLKSGNTIWDVAEQSEWIIGCVTKQWTCKLLT